MKKICLIILFNFLLVSCSNSESLHLEPGTFKGDLPCENCDFIETSLELHRDSTFILEQKKVGDLKSLEDEQLSGKFDLRKKLPNSPTEFKLGIIELKSEDNQTRYFRILSQNSLELLDENLESLDKKLKYALKRVSESAL